MLDEYKVYRPPWCIRRRVTTFHHCFTLVEGHCMVQAADSWHQAQANANQAAPNEQLGSSLSIIWDTCLSVTPVAKLLRSHRYKFMMRHPCPRVHAIMRAPYMSCKSLHTRECMAVLSAYNALQMQPRPQRPGSGFFAADKKVPRKE